MPYCPNCNASVATGAQDCASCRAQFVKGGWQLKDSPVSEAEKPKALHIGLAAIRRRFGQRTASVLAELVALAIASIVSAAVAFSTYWLLALKLGFLGMLMGFVLGFIILGIPVWFKTWTFIAARLHASYA